MNARIRKRYSCLIRAGESKWGNVVRRIIDKGAAERIRDCEAYTMGKWSIVFDRDNRVILTLER